MKPIRVLIVDDSATMRGLIAEVLTRDPSITVVGQAADPLEAREAIKALNPDVMTLDVEMPKMNGVEFLEKVMRLRPFPVIMVSTLTMAGVLMVFASRSRRLGKLTLRKFTLKEAGLFALLLAICIPATGCIKKSPAINSSGTQPGIYNYTVTATSGTVSHSVTIALTVN